VYYIKEGGQETVNVPFFVLNVLYLPVNVPYFVLNLLYFVHKSTLCKRACSGVSVFQEEGRDSFNVSYFLLIVPYFLLNLPYFLR
jgi:hypothetical protein